MPAGFSAPAPDWERIELDYRAGIKSLRQMADEHGLSEGAIRKRAKRDDWARDLSSKIQAKADDLVRRESVRSEVRTESRASERVLIEANAQVAADIRLSHRADIRRVRSLVASLMDELEQQAGTESAEMLRDLGEMMRSPDDAGQDKLNDLYRKIVSLPERSKTAKTLAESLRIAVDMERQAFGMDAKGADAAPGTAGYVPPAVQILHVAAPRREDEDE